MSMAWGAAVHGLESGVQKVGVVLEPVALVHHQAGPAHRPEQAPCLVVLGRVVRHDHHVRLHVAGPVGESVAAMAIYHMMQGFLSVFPQYNPPGNGSLGVNLFSESYGGKYGPAFADT